MFGGTQVDRDRRPILIVGGWAVQFGQGFEDFGDLDKRPPEDDAASSLVGADPADPARLDAGDLASFIKDADLFSFVAEAASGENLRDLSLSHGQGIN